MIFALNLFISILGSQSIQRFWFKEKGRKILPFLILYSPICLLWLIICSSQYKVGSDYESYYEIFSYPLSYYDFYMDRGEWLFSLVLRALYAFGVHPQLYFAFFYTINFIVVISIVYYLNDKNSWIFIMLYIAFSTVFNNQLNGLRQYSAIYIISLAFISFFHHKSYLKLIVMIVVAGGIHLSSYLSLMLLLFVNKKIGEKFAYFLLVAACMFVLFGSFNFTYNIINVVLPVYSKYLTGIANVDNSISIILTKFIFIPFYLFAISLMKRGRLDAFSLYLFRIGIISYAIRIAFWGNFIFNRVGQLFTLLSILPIYILIKELYVRKKVFYFSLTTGCIIMFYLIKTIVLPDMEYLYDSIFFHQYIPANN